MKKLLLANALLTPLLCFPRNAVQELTLDKPTARYSQTHQGITLTINQYKLIQQRATYQYKRKKYKTSPFYPVEIIVENQSNAPITLSPDTIDLASIEGKHLANLFSCASTVKAICRFAALPSLLCLTGGALMIAATPLVAHDFMGIIFWIAAGFTVAFYGITVSLATACVALPAGFLYKKRAHKKALTAATLTNDVIIKPGEKITKYLFVARPDFKTTFAVTLDNATFNVKLA